MPEPSDDRPPLVLAMQWTSRITAVALEMSLPALAGNWLDQRLGTRVVFLILGAVLGFGTGLWHLIRLTAKTGPDNAHPKGP